MELKCEFCGVIANAIVETIRNPRSNSALGADHYQLVYCHDCNKTKRAEIDQIVVNLYRFGNRTGAA